MDNWMKETLQNGNLKLHEITLPGSHDAGIFPDSVGSIGPAPTGTTVCQSHDIMGQCEHGSRFFDIRLRSHNGTVKTFHQMEVKKFLVAGSKRKLPVGAVGADLEEVLGHVYMFLKGNPSEFIILRLSHTFAKGREVMDYINSHPICELLYRGRGNIAKATVNELRGHVVLVCDSKFDVRPMLGFHKFSKYTAGVTGPGLTTCGEFSNKSSIREVFSKQIKRVSEHESHTQDDHLFVLYWQQTGGNVKNHTEKAVNVAKSQNKGRATGGTHGNMDYMVEVLLNGGSRYGEKWGAVTTTWTDRRRCMPNVILYDFVNSVTSKTIADLNDPGIQAHLAQEAADNDPWTRNAAFNDPWTQNPIAE